MLMPQKIKQLAMGQRVTLSITGEFGDHLAEVCEVDGKYGMPYFRVLNDDGSPDESWESFVLKDGDYIIHRLAEAE